MKQSNLVRLGALGLLVTGIVLAVLYRDRFDAAALQAWTRDAGVVAPLLFIAVYTVATVLFLPGSVVTLAGGALFGPVLGTLYNLTGATLGAALAFLVARYLARNWVEHRAGGRLGQLKRGVDAEGWRFVAFVRLVPLFPFNLLNYALGITRIRFSHYLVATYVCMLPGAVAYTYLGYAGREAVAGGNGLLHTGLLALALLAAAVFLPRFIARLRQGPMLEVEQLKQRLDRGDDVLVLDVRTSQDYVGEQGHITGSVNIPLEQLPERTAELQDHQEQAVAFVCRTDRRSAKAARLLARSGFGDVHIVRGGMTRWNELGYPVRH
ncbi:MAG: VTT domain-containing protein [Gammaproteobacteria bacterium]